MYRHLIFYQFKTLIRDKAMWFWTLIFPLILATLFNFAFSKLNEETSFKPVNIAVVNSESFKTNTSFSQLLKDVSSEKNKVFNIEYTSESKANKLLEDSKIDGFITVSDDILVVVKSSGINQTIIKSVVDSYKQSVSVVTNIIETNHHSITEGVLDNLSKEYDFFNDTTNSKADQVVSYFYALIAMSCLYGANFSLYVISQAEANLSKKGARTAVAPTHKFKVIASSLLVCITVHYLEMLLLISYISFVLNINLGNQVMPILILTFFGCLAGSTLGMFLTYTNKKKIETKMSIAISIIMVLSFLSGLMVLNVKYIVAQNAPLLGLINPATMITDALYALYYYTTYDRFIFNIISLLIFSVVMILSSYYFMRRKKYDSI